MSNHSVLDEVREGRERISRECDHDISRLMAYLRHYNDKCAEQLRRYRQTHGGEEAGGGARPAQERNRTEQADLSDQHADKQPT